MQPHRCDGDTRTMMMWHVPKMLQHIVGRDCTTYATYTGALTVPGSRCPVSDAAVLEYAVENVLSIKL